MAAEDRVTMDADREVTQGEVQALWLRSVPVEEALELLAGGRPDPADVRLHPQYPTGDTLDALAMLLGAHQAMNRQGRPGGPPWWVHQIVVGQSVVGDIGFHGPPAPERPWTVEIGYQVVPAWRGRGVATRACGLVLAQAWSDGADRVVAETDPGNTASHHVLAAHGFRLGRDGVYVRDRRSPAPSTREGPP